MNEILILLFLLLSSFFYKSQLEARPVSYGGGWTLMQNNDASRNSLHMYYSPSYKYSIGYKSEYLRHDNIALNSMQLNNLIKMGNFFSERMEIHDCVGKSEKLMKGVSALRGSTFSPAFCSMSWIFGGNLQTFMTEIKSAFVRNINYDKIELFTFKDGG